MKRLFSFAFILCLLAGILIGCSDSSNGFRRHRDINKEVLVFFNDDITPQEAREYIKDNDAYIIESNEAYDYYLITFATADDAEDFFFFLDDEDDPYVSFAVKNQYVDPCGIKITIIDDDKTIKPIINITHAEMVKRTVNRDEVFNPNVIDVKPVDSAVEMSHLTNAILKTCEKMNDDDLNIINISWGPADSIPIWNRQTKKWEKRWKTDEEYIESFVDFVTTISETASKCGKQNFIITESMGNHSVHHIDDAFNTPLFKQKMTSEMRKAMDEHMVLIAAKDTRKGLDYGYSNILKENAIKKVGVHTVMVDISYLPSELRGTSAAAPYLANWIAKSKFEKASDVIETVKKTTKEKELVSQNSFKEMANKVITNRTINESIPRDGKKPKSSKVAIGGTLRIYAYDDYGKKRLRYETNGLDYTTDKVVFVLESDTSINISPYLTPAEQSLLGGKRQTAFTVRFNNKIFLKKFAEKYAYKRVFVVGTLNAPMASIYTPTDVVINMESITIDDGEILKTEPIAIGDQPVLLEAKNNSYTYLIPGREDLFSNGMDYQFQLPNGDVFGYRYYHKGRFAWRYDKEREKFSDVADTLYYILLQNRINGSSYHGRLSDYVIQSRKYNSEIWVTADESVLGGIFSRDVLWDLQEYPMDFQPLIVKFAKRNVRKY